MISNKDNILNRAILDHKLFAKIVCVWKNFITFISGILQMKGGQVVLKNPGQPILNATLKPIQKVDIESLIDKKTNAKQQIKKYQARTGLERLSEQNSLFPDKPQGKTGTSTWNTKGSKYY